MHVLLCIYVMEREAFNSCCVSACVFILCLFIAPRVTLCSYFSSSHNFIIQKAESIVNSVREYKYNNAVHIYIYVHIVPGNVCTVRSQRSQHTT